MTYTATYSPDDNKLRLSASSRLPKELYERVKAAGYRWAPKQECFYATWHPGAEDIAVELAGEIDDDDRDLMSRAEERAERFDEYHENRKADAESARKAVAAIADHIPLGQPILIGHHSEKHARRDAEKIEAGMRRAVNAWKTAAYWTERAAAAIAHAKYKERPDVRARRIKTIEAEARKVQRTRDEAAKFHRAYTDPKAEAAKLRDGRELIPALLGTYEGGLSFERQREFTDGKLSRAEAQAEAVRNLAGSMARCDRWLEHFARRLAYERAMLADSGGTAADRTAPEAGGACKCWASWRGGFSYIQKVNRVSVTVLDNWHNANDADGGRNFTRNIPFDKLHNLMSRADVEAARADGRLVEMPDKTGFILRDAPPAPVRTPKAPDPEAAPFLAMQQSLDLGVQTVSAPQLFPTPPALAARMVELAEIEEGHRVLEPSAGAGAIVQAINGARCQLIVCEINTQLCARLNTMPNVNRVHDCDFLGFVDAGDYDRILMNPPFERGADIEHIEHARTLLRDGGRIVAICANGPRQRERLMPLATLWEDLPPGTFKEQGTNVNTALLVIDN